MKKKKFDVWSGLIVVFFACFLLYGIMAAQDYGLTSDDEYQRNHSIVTYNDIILKDSEYVTKSIDTTTLPPMSQYGANYGVIMQLPTVLLEHMNDFQYSFLEIYQIRHVYVFLWFFVAAITFYQMCLLMTDQNRLIAFLGTLMLILSPRILADSCYNIKDALCMSLYTIATYFGLRFIKKDSLLNLLLFVVATALCATSRIVGGVLIGALLLAVFCKGIYEGTWKKYLLYGAGMFLLFGAAYILMTPKSWGDILQNLLDTIQTFSNYTTWDGRVFFMGEWVEGDALPWYYLFVWIWITIPVVYSILIAVGFCNTILGIVGSLKDRNRLMDTCNRIFVLLAVVIPVAYVVLMKPTLYNGWRHFYFIYPLLVIQAVLLLSDVWKKAKKPGWKYVCLGALGLSFSVTGLWIGKNHPYEYVYFNPVIREYAFQSFDLDYWAMTEVECYQYILEQDAGENIKVTGFIPSCSPSVMGDEEPSRLVTVSTWNRAEWVIDDGKGFEGSDEFECVKYIEVDGHRIRSIWKRKNQNVASFTLDYTSQGIEGYAINDIVWESQIEDEEMVFTGMLEMQIPASQIVLEMTSETAAQHSHIEVSENGTDWRSIAEDGVCPIEYVAAVRVSVPMAEMTEGSLRITLQGDIESVRKLDVMGNRSIVRLETNAQGFSPVKNVMDDNRKTRWEVNNQTPGTYLDIHLDAAYELYKLQLDVGSSDDDYPRQLHVYTSMDGVTWEEQNYTTRDHQNYMLEGAVSCQYLRLQLGDTGEPIAQSWSLHELRLFTK